MHIYYAQTGAFTEWKEKYNNILLVRSFGIFRPVFERCEPFLGPVTIATIAINNPLFIPLILLLFLAPLPIESKTQILQEMGMMIIAIS